MHLVNRIKRAAILICAVLTLSSLFVFSACESGPKQLQFKNELETRVNIYFSRAIDDEWSEKPTATGIGSGASIGLNFSDFDGAAGKKTDIGAIDENSVNYDIYDVVLEIGDSITLVGSSSAAQFVITHADGSSTSLTAHINTGAN